MNTKKTIIRTTLILAVLFTFTNFEKLSKPKFNGVIKFNLEYDLPESMEEQAAVLPKEMEVIIGKKFSKTIQNTVMGDQIFINNLKNDNSCLLLDMMGQKMAIDIDNSARKENVTIIYTDETKNILGYKAKKALATFKEGEEEKTFEVWHTQQIATRAIQQVPGLSGFPLEFTIFTQGMTISYTAKDIKELKIDDKEFNTPDGFQKLTMDEFKAMMGM